jgi:hypothetical protein
MLAISRFLALITGATSGIATSSNALEFGDGRSEQSSGESSVHGRFSFGDA